MSLETCAGDPHGVRVVGRGGGGRTHLVGVTELGRMVGHDPHMALSVLMGLGGSEASMHSGGLDVQRAGWVRVGEEGDRSSSSSSSSNSNSNRRSNSTRTNSNGAPPPPPRLSPRPCREPARRRPREKF